MKSFLIWRSNEFRNSEIPKLKPGSTIEQHHQWNKSSCSDGYTSVIRDLSKSFHGTIVFRVSTFFEHEFGNTNYTNWSMVQFFLLTVICQLSTELEPSSIVEQHNYWKERCSKDGNFCGFVDFGKRFHESDFLKGFEQIYFIPSRMIPVMTLAQIRTRRLR